MGRRVLSAVANLADVLEGMLRATFVSVATHEWNFEVAGLVISAHHLRFPYAYLDARPGWLWIHLGGVVTDGNSHARPNREVDLFTHTWLQKAVAYTTFNVFMAAAYETINQNFSIVWHPCLLGNHQWRVGLSSLNMMFPASMDPYRNVQNCGPGCSKESGPRMAKDPAYAEAVPASQKKSADPLVARITCCRWPRLSAWRSDPVLEARM